MILYNLKIILGSASCERQRASGAIKCILMSFSMRAAESRIPGNAQGKAVREAFVKEDFYDAESSD